MQTRLISDARHARAFFPLAPRKQRVSQAVAYAKARQYLRDNGLEAAVIDSKFQYESVLGGKSA